MGGTTVVRYVLRNKDTKKLVSYVEGQEIWPEDMLQSGSPVFSLPRIASDGVQYRNLEKTAEERPELELVRIEIYIPD